MGDMADQAEADMDRWEASGELHDLVRTALVETLKAPTVCHLLVGDKVACGRIKGKVQHLTHQTLPLCHWCSLWMMAQRRG